MKRRVLLCALVGSLTATAGPHPGECLSSGLGTWLLPPPASAADRIEPAPKELEGVGITEKLDSQIPLDLEFTDEDGRTIRLADIFTGRRPVILNLAYYECPMLCTLVLNGVVEGMKGLTWTLGKDYDNVTVSINPAETPALARAKKENYLESYGRPGTAAGWHFLTGKQENITALAQAVGFNYRYDAETHQFIHTAGTFLCTPGGRISRVLYGIEYEPQTFRLGLLEAAQGKIGSPLDQLVLYCFHYDSQAGRYGIFAQRLMRTVGAVSAVALGGVLLGFWTRDRRRRASAGIEGGQG